MQKQDQTTNETVDANTLASSKGWKKDRPTIDVFPNQFPECDYTHRIVTSEYTSVCPKTGHPDFGTVEITYIADRVCVELKALKVYFQSYRNDGIFYENLVNTIARDFVEACHPKRLRVKIIMTGRGGVQNTLVVEHVMPGMEATRFVL